jgi:hypothetical protein
METETINQNPAAAALDGYNIVVSSLGLLRITAGPTSDGALNVTVTSLTAAQPALWLALRRGESGWQIFAQGGKEGSGVRLSATRQAEICGLVKEWARTHVQDFINADREYFFEMISGSVEIIADDEFQLPWGDDDVELCEALDKLGPSFLTLAALAGMRRGIELLASAHRMVQEAEALFRRAMAEKETAV